MAETAERAIRDQDYRQLLAFRSELRRFLRWSEEEATASGITPMQHQLLLAVRGHEDRRGPTIGDLAELLLLRHHSAVELVDRAVRAGLVHRIPDREDHRAVRVRLTPVGSRRLGDLSAAHLEEIRRLGPALGALWTEP
jgi:DNA-binding MarR family transcriptional regulator